MTGTNLASVSSTTAARKAGSAAAIRLFRGTPRGPRFFHSLKSGPLEAIDKINFVTLAVGPVFDIVVPCSALAPCCICCGDLLTWEKLSVEGHRLPLGRGGFYVCCDSCKLKNQAIITKEWQTAEEI